MSANSSVSSRFRKRLLAAVATAAVAGAVGLGAVTSGTQPVRADAVRVDQTAQMPSFADVVEKVSPAVVSVRVKSDVETTSSDVPGMFFDMPGLDQLPDDHPLKRFFREFRQDRHRRHRHELRPVAQGSGFFISQDGYLVTNNHVVDGGSAFTVILDDGTELDAKLIGTDPRTDLAVLKVDAGRKFTYVDFADDSKVRVGDWVVAVGNPFGLGGTVTAGIVSARGREIGAGPYDDFIQIDAAVNRGNSGGPAFNLSGQVIGVNTAIFSPSGGNVGIAFAIPSSIAKTVVNDLIEDGEVTRGWLGVYIQPVTETIAESLGLEENKGALVAEPQEGSPAKKAGVKAGDVVIAVDGKKIDSPRELARMIAAMDPGTKVDLTLWRNGKSQQVEVELGEMPKDQEVASLDDRSSQSGNALSDFGMTVAPADDGKGLVVTDVEPGSSADEHGIRAGDVILSVNSRDVSSPDDISKAVEDAAKDGRKAVLFQISRDETNRFVALPVAKS